VLLLLMWRCVDIPLVVVAWTRWSSSAIIDLSAGEQFSRMAGEGTGVASGPRVVSQTGEKNVSNNQQGG
jgi:hypothetical protein